MLPRKTASLLAGLRFDKSAIGIVRPFDDPAICAVNILRKHPETSFRVFVCLSSRFAWPIRQKHYRYVPNP